MTRGQLLCTTVLMVISAASCQTYLPNQGCPINFNPLVDVSIGNVLLCDPFSTLPCQGLATCLIDSANQNFICCAVNNDFNFNFNTNTDTLTSPNQNQSRLGGFCDNGMTPTLKPCSPGMWERGCGVNEFCRFDGATFTFKCCRKNDGEQLANIILNPTEVGTNNRFCTRGKPALNEIGLPMVCGSRLQSCPNGFNCNQDGFCCPGRVPVRPLPRPNSISRPFKISECPTNYEPVTTFGTNVQLCFPGNQNSCGYDSRVLCLQSKISTSSFVCCRPSVNRPQATPDCPSNYEAETSGSSQTPTSCTLGVNRQCVDPQAICSYSSNRRSYVCCKPVYIDHVATSQGKCTDGSEPLLDRFNRPLFCQSGLLEGICPTGYFCDIDVCCSSDRMDGSSTSGDLQISIPLNPCPSQYAPVIDRLTNEPQVCSLKQANECPGVCFSGMNNNYYCCLKSPANGDPSVLLKPILNSVCPSEYEVVREGRFRQPKYCTPIIAPCQRAEACRYDVYSRKSVCCRFRGSNNIPTQLIPTSTNAINGALCPRGSSPATNSRTYQIITCTASNRFTCPAGLTCFSGTCCRVDAQGRGSVLASTLTEAAVGNNNRVPYETAVTSTLPKAVFGQTNVRCPPDMIGDYSSGPTIQTCQPWVSQTCNSGFMCLQAAPSVYLCCRGNSAYPELPKGELTLPFLQPFPTEDNNANANCPNNYLPAQNEFGIFIQCLSLSDCPASRINQAYSCTNGFCCPSYEVSQFGPFNANNPGRSQNLILPPPGSLNVPLTRITVQPEDRRPPVCKMDGLSGQPIRGRNKFCQPRCYSSETCRLIADEFWCCPK